RPAPMAGRSKTPDKTSSVASIGHSSDTGTEFSQPANCLYPSITEQSGPRFTLRFQGVCFGKQDALQKSCFLCAGSWGLHVWSCFEIQSCALDDSFPCREFVCGGSDDPVMPGGQPGEMASGAHHLVLRDVCASSIFPGLQAFSRRFSLAIQ